MCVSTIPPIPHAFLSIIANLKCKKLIKTHSKLKSPIKNLPCKLETSPPSRFYAVALSTQNMAPSVALGPLLTVPSARYRFLKVTQLSEWWLCLGYEFVGRNLTSSVLCGFFAIMYFQRKTTKIAMFRMWGEDTLQFPLRHDLMMMLWPLPWLQQPLAPLSRQEAGWACIHVPEHPLLAAGLNLLVSAQSQPPRPS